MRILTVSDLHIDFSENYEWLTHLSGEEYKNDILILAGDISHQITHIEQAFTSLAAKFAKVFYVPGNHDLWITNNAYSTSLEKLHAIETLARQAGIGMEPGRVKDVWIVPLFGWYDYSFGRPNEEVRNSWVDFYACKWPSGQDVNQITKDFTDRNRVTIPKGDPCIISFSHFLPRIDIMPDQIPESKRTLYPVLGSVLLEKQIRVLESDIHIYGHSHINRNICKDNTRYINNAYGYPYEAGYTRKKLLCVHEF
ncbi:metallophosphoesterase [Gorillibacterium sp. sgz500922]|uniref:metallophosphoesterase n=1 Tax=Gorillibacterium sp. sgz500922 TaxID=3446694 RepID=UPI003F67CB02